MELFKKNRTVKKGSKVYTFLRFLIYTAILSIVVISFLKGGYIFDYIDSQGELFWKQQENPHNGYKTILSGIWYFILKIHYALLWAFSIMFFKSASFIWRKHVVESTNFI
jgi:hypothetical protein|tara:strand:+ start:180 stop:509 length:330 start_codon:yes stop_codon:yes gene_type:complete